MKKIYFLIASLVILPNFLHAQQPDYKVVFDMSSRDSMSQQSVVREVELISGENPDARLEVVIYVQGITLVTKTNSKHAEAIQALTAKKNVSFKVCAITMKRNNLTKSDLLPGIQVVPDGIYEIISKQHEGWGYIKVAH
ncbi:MAG: DsrE family protein [Ferruginibacter sp.]